MNGILSAVEGVFRLVRSYGIAVRFADLGDWGCDELRSEYDPAMPEIRLNIRVAAELGAGELDTFVGLAVGHELYHHREAIGEVAVLAGRFVREAAADAYAGELMKSSR